MNRLTRVLAVLTITAVSATAMFMSGKGSTNGNAQEEPPAPSPHAIMIEQKLCIVLQIALANVDSTVAATTCVDLYAPNSLLELAAYLTQSNGEDDPIINTGLIDDPDTPQDERRIDVPCTSDGNGDGEFCEAGDAGVDDGNEVTAQIDMRDDGKLDGLYELRASDFASMDLDGNQMHQQDGNMYVLVFNDGDDQPARFRPEVGKIDQPLELINVDDIACGSTHVPGASYFDEDCDDDNIPGDGVKVAHFITGSPLPDLGDDYQLRITETDRETYLPFSVVGEPDDLSFTLLKPVATTGVPEDECRFDLSVAGVVEALGNPDIAIVLVHALDRDGTQVANTLLDWEVDPAELAYVFLPQTPTVDLGSFGKGFPQAICGDEGTGIADVTAMFSATVTIDPPAPDPEDSEASFEVTVLGEADSIAVVSTPAQVACDGTQSATLAATVTDANGDLIANGTPVEFDIQVLGTANPIVATTTDGIATSVITPLAAVGTGAPVVITAGEDEASVAFLVQCAAGSPQAPPTPGTGTGTGQPGSGITGPDTGSGGQAGGRGELNAWPVVALFVAAMGLAGARFGLRRVG